MVVPPVCPIAGVTQHLHAECWKSACCMCSWWLMHKFSLPAQDPVEEPKAFLASMKEKLPSMPSSVSKWWGVFAAHVSIC